MGVIQRPYDRRVVQLAGRERFLRETRTEFLRVACRKEDIQGALHHRFVGGIEARLIADVLGLQRRPGFGISLPAAAALRRRWVRAPSGGRPSPGSARSLSSPFSHSLSPLITLWAKPSPWASLSANSRRVITVGFTSRRSVSWGAAQRAHEIGEGSVPSTIRSTSLPGRSVPLPRCRTRRPATLCAAAAARASRSTSASRRSCAAVARAPRARGGARSRGSAPGAHLLPQQQAHLGQHAQFAVQRTGGSAGQTRQFAHVQRTLGVQQQSAQHGGARLPEELVSERRHVAYFATNGPVSRTSRRAEVHRTPRIQPFSRQAQPRISKQCSASRSPARQLDSEQPPIQGDGVGVRRFQIQSQLLRASARIYSCPA